MAGAWGCRADVLPLAAEVWWAERKRCPAAEGIDGRECEAEAPAGRARLGGRCAQGVARKKMVSTQLRRKAVSFLKERGLSERRSCVLAGKSRSSLHYITHPSDDRELEQSLREI